MVDKKRSVAFRVFRLMYISFPGMTFGLYLGLSYHHFYLAYVYMGWLLFAVLLLD